MLRQQLVPCNGAAAHHAQAGKDEVQREVAVLDRLQVTVIGILQTLGAQRAAAGKTGVTAPSASNTCCIYCMLAATHIMALYTGTMANVKQVLLHYNISYIHCGTVYNPLGCVVL